MLKIVSQVKGDGFTWGGTDSPSDYDKAKAYLLKSAAAAGVLKRIEDELTLVVHLLITTDPNVTPNYYPYMMTRKFHTAPAGNLITWNPKGVLNVTAIKRGLKPVPGKQSPALALLHEMGHALQHFDKREWFAETYTKVLAGDEPSLLAIENDNIATHELPVATELGEAVRYAYRHVGDVEYTVYSYPD